METSGKLKCIAYSLYIHLLHVMAPLSLTQKAVGFVFTCHAITLSVSSVFFLVDETSWSELLTPVALMVISLLSLW